MPDPTLPEVMAGQTISSDCDPPRGGDHPAKKTIAPDTAPRLMQRKNSCFRPVNMLTGCPGIFRFLSLLFSLLCEKNVN
ncbi:HNH endonuclease, partial [Escherichia coli]